MPIDQENVIVIKLYTKFFSSR